MRHATGAGAEAHCIVGSDHKPCSGCGRCTAGFFPYQGKHCSKCSAGTKDGEGDCRCPRGATCTGPSCKRATSGSTTYHFFPPTCSTCDCKTDVCAGVRCSTNQYCDASTNGNCQCKNGYTLSAGKCFRCPDHSNSNLRTGTCQCKQGYKCNGLQSCKSGESFDPLIATSTTCVPDACADKRCPTGSACSDGECKCTGDKRLVKDKCVECPSGTETDSSGNCRCSKGQSCSGSACRTCQYTSF